MVGWPCLSILISSCTFPWWKAFYLFHRVSLPFVVKIEVRQKEGDRTNIYSNWTTFPWWAFRRTSIISALEAYPELHRLSNLPKHLHQLLVYRAQEQVRSSLDSLSFSGSQCQCKVTLNSFWKVMVTWGVSRETEEGKCQSCIWEGQEGGSGEPQASQSLGRWRSKTFPFLFKGKNPVSIKVWQDRSNKLTAGNFIDTVFNSRSP